MVYTVLPGPTISTIPWISSAKDSFRSNSPQIRHRNEYVIWGENQHHICRLQTQLVQSHSKPLHPMEQCARGQELARIDSINPHWFVRGWLGAEEVSEDISGGNLKTVGRFDDHGFRVAGHCPFRSLVILSDASMRFAMILILVTPPFRPRLPR